MNLQNEVKNYWEAHPLLDFEIRNESASLRWAKLDEVKRNNVEKFAQTLWRFDKVKEFSVLDIGCGPGWPTVQHAKNQANIVAIDLTRVSFLSHWKDLRGEFFFGLDAHYQRWTIAI
jgi:2-polyprenyl-3-methyl-5-hydroxy-6-metoxy-1,4-benzoquinol methylase